MYKNIKWTEIITQESQITKTSALYIIPLDENTCKLIYVDDEGSRRTISMSGGSGASKFIELSDAPLTYLNNAHKLVKVNSSETGLEFTDITPGQDGKSAYQIALDEGFVGTESEWLLSLKGDTGSQGAGGFSAYQIALNNGFSGTEQQWLDSLKGEDGIQGEEGLSAYQIAIDNGFVGTETQWLDSLKGEDGVDGSIDLLTFNVDQNMHLIMQLETNTSLDFTLDDNGHLILTN